MPSLSESGLVGVSESSGSPGALIVLVFGIRPPAIILSAVEKCKNSPEPSSTAP